MGIGRNGEKAVIRQMSRLLSLVHEGIIAIANDKEVGGH